MKKAIIVLARKWGKGFRRITITANAEKVGEFENYVFEDGNGKFYLSAWAKGDLKKEIEGEPLNSEVKIIMGEKWFVESFTIEAESTESTESTESALQEVVETAVAKLDSVVETKHTAQVDRFYIHNYKNGVTRLYWFNKSALACGIKTIVHRDGVETVVRNERFRDFVAWEKSRESYTKYCKANALKGGE